MKPFGLLYILFPFLQQAGYIASFHSYLKLGYHLTAEKLAGTVVVEVF